MLAIQCIYLTACLYFTFNLTLSGVPAHAVGKEVAESLLNQLCHGGCVDDFLQDQVGYSLSSVNLQNRA